MYHACKRSNAVRFKNLNLINVRLASTNEFGIQMIDEKFRSHLFGDAKSIQIDPQAISSAKEHLKKFDLLDKKFDPLRQIDNLELPRLCGSNIEEHFENIGNKLTKNYLKLLSSLSSTNLPKKPDNFVLSPGWTRYDPLTNKTTKVAYPQDDALIFDVETLVKHQNRPVMAVAASTNAWYSWCSDIFFQDDFNGKTPIELTDLITLESPDSDVRKRQKRVVIGHNVGFDRSFIKEQYYLEKSGMRFLDTMSMHISCSGFSSEQRLQKLSTTPKNTSPIQGGYFSEFWKSAGCLNNLKDVHSFYCPNDSPVSKDERDTFVKGDLKDVRDNFESLINYCANDVLATFQVFCKLFEIFIERFPHPVTLCGMLEMSTMYLPVNQNWIKFKNNCHNSHEETQDILRKLLEKSANEGCEFLNEKENDPWLFNLDWDCKVLKPLKNVSKSKQKELDLESLGFGLNQKQTIENKFFKILPDNEQTKIKKELKEELCPNSVVQEAMASAAFLSKIKPHLINYPNWYRNLCDPGHGSENWQPGPCQITTKLRVTPSLLRLTWHGHPLYYHEEKGWSYIINHTEIEKQNKKLEEKNKVIKKPCRSKKKVKELLIEKLINDQEYAVIKIPHKDGEKLNVGNPLSKTFLAKIEEGILGSIPKRSADLALQLYSAISYWENNEKRINDQKAIWINKTTNNDTSRSIVGAILPNTIVSGTITRRAVESCWLTASSGQKKNRIGGELKCMIQPPDGYAMVGADVDSQELWIATLLGDSSSTHIHGCTASSWMNLQGKKSDHSDIHSKTASMIGISRDQAKVFNYGRIYGAGRKFAEKLLLQFNPELTEVQASEKARFMFEGTKGKKKKIDDKVMWDGGTESAMFNKLEEIAKQKRPQTPVLNAAITKVLEPALVGDDFMTSRINWVVQSSAVDYLHIMLVCMNWLIDEFEIDARFSISIHDEIRYIVKEEDKYRLALALQITNFYTRSLFAYKLGFDSLPMSVAFFSGVDIDGCLRKEPYLEFVSPSNPNGMTKGYGIKKGYCLDIYQIIEKTNGSLEKK